jgi:hypothetical protein
VPTLSPADRNDPEVAQLTAAQQVELRARHDGTGEPGRPPSASDVAVVLLVRDDEDSHSFARGLR